MAFRICTVLFWAYFSSISIQANAESCPDYGYYSNGFDCPRWFIDDSDEYYCCDSGTSYQTCCDSSTYYGYGSLSTGAIIGIAIGSVVFIVVVIISIIVCCVCCCVSAAARPQPHPITMQTVSVPPQTATVQQPAVPGYYYPQQPAGALSAPPPYAAQQPPQPVQPQPIPGQIPK